MAKRILMIEDEEHIRELASANISQLGYQLVFAHDGVEGVEEAQSKKYSLIVLDLMLPKLGGIEVLQEIRKSDQRIPILILTAKGEEVDRVLGLELGADDYLTKPFSVAELKARIKALLRRAERFEGAESLGSKVFGKMKIDFETRTVFINDELVDLSALEFDLLAYLATHPGKPFTRSELLSSVWGVANPAYEINVNTQITRLRKKIERDLKNPEFVITVWGVGYKFGLLEDK